MDILTPIPRGWAPGAHRAPRAWKGLLGLLLACSLASCATQQRARLGTGFRGASLTPSTLPDWAGESISWEKLDRIETWLAEESRGADPFWRVEAELQLAEGRMSFASEAGDAEIRRQRRRNARTGFLRVRTDPGASTSQRNRATAGLAGSLGAGSPREAVAPAVGGVLGRHRWGARNPNPNNLTRATSPWSFITIHHSALEGAPPMGTSEADAIQALRMVQRSHMDGRNYGDVGYHFFIDPAGRVWQGRDMSWQGAHAGGRHGNNNVGNIGVCLLGNFDEVRPTRAALAALDDLVRKLENHYSIPHNGIVAHSDWKGTICPGRFLLPHVRRLAR